MRLNPADRVSHVLQDIQKGISFSAVEMQMQFPGTNLVNAASSLSSHADDCFSRHCRMEFLIFR